MESDLYLSSNVYPFEIVHLTLDFSLYCTYLPSKKEEETTCKCRCTQKDSRRIVSCAVLYREEIQWWKNHQVLVQLQKKLVDYEYVPWVLKRYEKGVKFFDWLSVAGMFKKTTRYLSIDTPTNSKLPATSITVNNPPGMKKLSLADGKGVPWPRYKMLLECGILQKTIGNLSKNIYQHIFHEILFKWAPRRHHHYPKVFLWRNIALCVYFIYRAMTLTVISRLFKVQYSVSLFRSLD